MKNIKEKIVEAKQNYSNNKYDITGLTEKEYHTLAAFVELVFKDDSKKEFRRIQNYMDMHDWDTDIEWKDIASLYDKISLD